GARAGNIRPRSQSLLNRDDLRRCGRSGIDLGRCPDVREGDCTSIRAAHREHAGVHSVWRARTVRADAEEAEERIDDLIAAEYDPVLITDDSVRYPSAGRIVVA